VQPAALNNERRGCDLAVRPPSRKTHRVPFIAQSAVKGGLVNWKVIFQMSLFGLAMGISTVFLIPSTIEPLFWLGIFGITAYLIARRCSGQYFVHGLLVGLVNSVWVTASHILLFDRYIANHPQEAAMMSSMPLPDFPRLMMALVGPVIGVVSGLAIGALAVLAAKMVARVPSTVA